MFEFLLTALVFAFATFALRAVFAFFAVVDVLVLRGGGRCRRTGALVFVVLGRELRNTPRTSSSDCWALAIRKAPANASAANGAIKILDFISLTFRRVSEARPSGRASQSILPSLTVGLLKHNLFHLCAILILITTGAPSLAPCGTLTDTNGAGAFFITSVPARFGLN